MIHIFKNTQSLVIFFLTKIFKVYVKLGNQNWTLDRRYNEFDRLNNEVFIYLRIIVK